MRATLLIALVLLGTASAWAAEEPSGAFAVGVVAGGALVAVGFVAPDGEPGGWRIRGMATVAAARGKGAGSAVLEALLAHAAASGATRVWCNVRTPARSLYERAGLRAASEEFELPHIGPHFVMERSLAGDDAPRSLRARARRTASEGRPVLRGW